MTPQAHGSSILGLGGSMDSRARDWRPPHPHSIRRGAGAREKGIGSIQFEPQQGETPLGTFDLTGLTEMVLVDLDGDKGCGVDLPSQTPLRAGWRASRQCACATAYHCKLHRQCNEQKRSVLVLFLALECENYKTSSSIGSGKRHPLRE